MVDALRSGLGLLPSTVGVIERLGLSVHQLSVPLDPISASSPYTGWVLVSDHPITQRAVETMKKLPRRTEGDPLAVGKVDAPVVMVEWSDFRCPFCSVWSRDTLPQLKPYIDSGSLRIEHRDLVLFGEQSQLTAQAGRAAGNQGKFWEFDAAVHAAAPTSGHPDITKADLIAFAQKAGVPDIAKFTTDMTSAESVQAVNKDIGLSGTPFFVINTTPMSGAQPLATFVQTIEANGGHK